MPLDMRNYSWLVPKMYILFDESVWQYLGEETSYLARIAKPWSETILAPKCKLKPITRVNSYFLRDFGDYPPHHQIEAKRRYVIIKSALADINTPVNIDELAKSLNTSKSTAMRFIERYILSGERITSLIPNVGRFGQGHRHISPEAKYAINQLADIHYLIPENPKLRSAAKAIKTDLKSNFNIIVSLNTIIRALNRIPKIHAATQRIGIKSTVELYRLNKGKAPIGERPLSLVQIDHTLLNIFILLPSGRTVRVWITVAIDTYSRMIIGFYLSLNPPSAYSVGMSLYRAMQPKEKILEHFKISSPWPCRGKPSTVQLDNALSHKGYSLEEIAFENDITIMFSQITETPAAKHIESWMGTIALSCELLSGKSFHSVLAKGNYPAQDSAVLSFDELEAIIHHFIVNYYHNENHSGLRGLSPLQKWNDYFAQYGGLSGSKVVYAGEQLLYSLLPSFFGRITKNGFCWKGLYYYNSALQPFVKELYPGRADGKWPVRYDPNDIGTVYWKDPLSKSYIPLALRDYNFPRMNVWERDEYKGKDKEAAKKSRGTEFIEEGQKAISEITDKAVKRKAISLKEHKHNFKKRKSQSTKPIAPLEPQITSESSDSLLSNHKSNPPNNMWKNIPSFKISRLKR